MTHQNAAATADPQASWSKVLRITEVAAGLPVSSQRRTEMPAILRLRAGMAMMQTAWRWVESKRSQQIASKRLRVAETISQYLIGSSSGGVQLLTRLDPQTTEQDSRNEVAR
jgi:hypothetical protein